MGTVKCIGILTSGGDAPGMNAAIRAVTRAAIYNGLQVKGIYRGYKGLVTGEIKEFKSQNVSNIIQLGGTILKTARCKEFTTPEGRQLAYDNMKREGIDALVKKINDFNDKYAGLDYAKNLLVDGEFKTAIWDSGLQKVSLAANYFDQYAAEVGAVPEVKKLTDADKATVIALHKKVNALEDSYAATWKYGKADLTKVTGTYADYERLKAAYKHFLEADVKAFKALENFEEVTQGTVEGTTTKYFFDASEKNVGAVKAQRAAYDALVSNYGYADINTNGIPYTSAANSEARILAAEHNQGADAAYDVKDTKKLQAYLNNATLKVTTKALGNNKIRVNARFDAETYKDIVAECGNDYTISYKFYQKSAKATSFKGPKEKSRNYITYTKASLKKGTKYKFQCGVVIKDAQGNVVAEKSYKASTTGSRICR